MPYREPRVCYPLTPSKTVVDRRGSATHDGYESCEEHEPDESPSPGNGSSNLGKIYVSDVSAERRRGFWSQSDEGGTQPRK